MPTTPSITAQYLLTRLIDVIPEYTTIEPFRDNNLNEWRAHGSYSVKSSDKKSFVLNVNHREFASILYADAQHLLNHASEQRAFLLGYNPGINEASPSWGFVTLYYFAIFIAMAWTRAANNTVIYLDKDAVLEFCKGQPSVPPAGAYSVIFHLDPATGAGEVEFKKTNHNHFHEAVWVAAIKITEDVAKWITHLSSARKPTDDEVLSLRAMQLFHGLRFCDPYIWPSKLRNAINYRPGYSYRSVIKHNFLTMRSKLLKPSFSSMEELIDFGEQMKTSLASEKSPINLPNEATDFLLTQALILEKFTDEAFQEICSLRDIKTSTLTLRNQFNKTYCNFNSRLTKIKI